jgi:protein-S-isoprenylcysteine O-methyltransferase Ste14
MHRVVGLLVRVGLVATVVGVFWVVPDLRLSGAENLALIWVGPLLAYPAVRLGRLVLDRHRSPDWIAWTTAGVQLCMMYTLGVPLVRAITTHSDWPGMLMPVPSVVGLAMVLVTGAVALATVVNLALRGLGAPFFIKLSGRLAADWMYAWTRNPMVLATLGLLVSLGFWFRSLLFIIWVVIMFAPALLFFVRVFEERELEFRFGESYLDYRSRTPFLFPRRQHPRGFDPK